MTIWQNVDKLAQILVGAGFTLCLVGAVLGLAAAIVRYAQS